MDPSSTTLSFAEGRVLLPFWIALTTGLSLASAVFLARPWPPRGARVGLLCVTALIWVIALGYLLIERRLVIDPEARQVREGHLVLGWGPQRAWSFGGIAAVVLLRAPDGRFDLGLQAGGERIAVRGYTDVLQAEQEALALANFGGWKALRRGYRLERDPAGKPQTFRTAQGKQGVVFDFSEVVQIVDTPGDEVIEPLP